MNRPLITHISEIKTETKDIKTIRFHFPNSIEPGQFFMIWIPGVDEIPMSVSVIDGEIKGITFRKIGDATKALFSLKTGDIIGIRGPYGNGFHLTGKHILFVGGGTGIAMLAPAVEQALQKRINSTIVIGAKTKNELFFEERFRNLRATVYVTTDDGTQGYKGFASDYAKELLATQSFTSLLTCGPEIMMKKLLEISGRIPFQASVERYMKCSIGICGQCCMGKGLRVCKEGPVLDGEILKHVDDFGVFRRDAAGRKVRL